MKYGYGRATDQLNIELRHGRIPRSEALEIAKKIDGQVNEQNVVDFCEYVEISREEYDEIMDSFVNHDIFSRSDSGEWELIHPRK